LSKSAKPATKIAFIKQKFREKRFQNIVTIVYNLHENGVTGSIESVNDCLGQTDIIGRDLKDIDTSWEKPKNWRQTEH